MGVPDRGVRLLLVHATKTDDEGSSPPAPSLLSAGKKRGGQAVAISIEQPLLGSVQQKGSTDHSPDDRVAASWSVASSMYV